MAKPTIKFYAAPYEVNGYTGYRPQLEAQEGKYDLDFCTEVVNEKRLAMSPDELLHALEMTGEVASKKVAEDGRPRGITKLIKWNRFAAGNLDSPSSPWNSTCRAIIKPQLLADATKIIDANFVNVTDGIGVKLSNVTWIGAKDVINVIKPYELIGANGNHMEFNAALGDKASLTVGEETYELTCTGSDVTRATFEYPEALDVEPGTIALFEMQSRGGIAGGQVYTSKKKVVVLAPEGPAPLKITKVTSSRTGREDEIDLFNGMDDTLIAGKGFDDTVTATYRLVEASSGDTFELGMVDGNKLMHLDDGSLKLHIQRNDSPMTDGDWKDERNAVYLVVRRGEDEVTKRINVI